MTIAARIRNAAENLDAQARERDFLLYAKSLLVSGSVFHAVNLLREWGAPSHLAEIMKASVDPGTLGSDGTWGSQLAAYRVMAQGFSQALRTYGVFDGMLASALQVPIDTYLAIATTGATGTTPAEAQQKPLSSLALSRIGTMTPLKSVCIVAVSDALARVPGSETFIGGELKAAVAQATDAAFLSIALASGIYTHATAGSSAANALTDIGNLIANVATDARSRLFFATTSTIAKQLAIKQDSAGSRLFPDLTLNPLGGNLAGAPLLVSDAITSGDLLLIDASAIAANADVVTLDTSSQASLQLNTSPDSPETASSIEVSAW